jgi:hypothetical protein
VEYFDQIGEDEIGWANIKLGKKYGIHAECYKMYRN